MKKFFLLSLVVVIGVSAASAQLLVKGNSLRNDKIANMKVPSQTVTNATKHFYAPFTIPMQLQDAGKGLKRIAPKDEDVQLYYVRPEATFMMAFDFDSFMGYRDHIVAPAFAPLTWVNRSSEGTNATWMFYDMNSEEMQESDAADLVMTPHSTDVGYWNYMPYLALTEEDFYQDSLTIKYGGDPSILFDDYSQESYPVALYDVWTDACNYDSYNIGLNCVNTAGSDGYNNYDELWDEELKDIYENDADNISNARLHGLVQFVGAPASPYIMYNVRWTAYWKSSKGFTVKLRILGQDENGHYTKVIGEATQPLSAHSSFSGAHLQFPLQTTLSDGGVIEGVVVDGPVVYELTGFHEEGMDANVTNFLSPIEMMLLEEMQKRLQFNAGAHVAFDYNNDGTTERLETYERIQNGYYADEGRDTVVYTHSYPVYMDMEYPFIYSENDKVEIPAAGGDQEIMVVANHMSEEWEITDENGNFELPEWFSFDFADGELEDANIYNDTTMVTFAADAMPDGLTGRQAKIVLSFPSFEAPAVQKVITITQGAVGVPGDVNGDGVCNSGDVTILYNYFLDGATEGLVNGDVDGDGNITSGDITFIYNLLLGSAK